MELTFTEQKVWHIGKRQSCVPLHEHVADFREETIPFLTEHKRNKQTKGNNRLNLSLSFFQKRGASYGPRTDLCPQTPCTYACLQLTPGALRLPFLLSLQGLA